MDICSSIHKGNEFTFLIMFLFRFGITDIAGFIKWLEVVKYIITIAPKKGRESRCPLFQGLPLYGNWYKMLFENKLCQIKDTHLKL